MFYSQFILAKKGPLGTIWIAAHLERKLRKNQVADTDIGVSVDSILSPDVPIALRLSSHLLLGVVRIYSKKVNYLFDDCSEALLKIKQAFRSAAVDLPPEESKAPYHSITMPETFDLDDFELPDNDLLQGNFVDHHISSREQITLQDTMEGVSYSTSKFGLDERFGDADAPELDLEEEILLCKTRTTESANESADPGTSISIKLDDISETTAFNSGIMVDHFHDNADLIDSAQAPSTPGLVEEPNLSKASAFDDPLESDYHLVESSMTENAKESSSEHKHEADWFSHDILNSDVIPDPLNSEKGSNMPRETELSSVNDQSFELKPSTESLGESEVLEETAFVAADRHVDEKIEVEKNMQEISGVTHSCKQGLGEISTNGQNSPEVIVVLSEEISNDQHKLCSDTNGSVLLNAREDSGLLKAHEKEGLAGTPFIRPCNSSNEQTNSTIPGMYVDIYEQFDAVAIESSWKEETPKLVEVAHSDAELHESEKLMSAPEGILNENGAVLVDSGPGKLSGNEEGDDGSKMISGKKRSFTESTLTEQSLNSAESSRLVRLKKTAESVPDDDDLLSSILAGRSSVLKVKPTPRLSEVTSMKRIQSASRPGAPKRKILMDDTMILHGDIIRQQLIDTEDIRRLRKKAPCTRPEISMIQKQYFGDDFFLEPVSIGMSNDLVSLQVRCHDLSQITVLKSDPEGVSNEIVATNEQESRVTPQDVENLESRVKENDDNLRMNDEELNSNDNITKDQARASNFSEVLQQNAAGLEELSRRNDDDANSNILDPTPSGIIPDEATNAAFELDFMNRQAITGDEATGNDKNIDVNVEADHVVADDDAKDKEPEYNENSIMINDFSGQPVEFSYPEVNMQEDDFADIDGIREQSELHPYDTEFGENSEQHIHDQDVTKYSPCDIDTEFLNFDDEGDDEQNEKVDDPLPEDQEARFTENTGWSSRTRAVSKYLDTLFSKEAESGRKSLSMEKLLGGKSRKEASRLFFEALVLKTRDHINVVQQNPFGDIIIIKPRSRRGC